MNSGFKPFPSYDEHLPGSELQPGVGPVPPVVKWYRVYCVVMTLLYIGLIAAGAALILYRGEISSATSAQISSEELTIRGIIVIVGCILMFAINFAALFLPTRAWAWTFHLVNIGLGLTGCCALVTIPLLIFWLKPEVQRYFGRDNETTKKPDRLVPPPIPPA